MITPYQKSTANTVLLDKSLYHGADFAIDPSSNDLETVTNVNSVLQTAQNRILARKGTWLLDEDYGSEVYKLIQRGGAIEDTELEGVVKQALKTMLDDGRIDRIVEAKVINDYEDKTRLDFSIILEVGGSSYIQSYRLNYL